MRGLWLAGAGLVVLGGGAHAADLSAALPTKAPPPIVAPAYDWTGYHIGAHFGYAAGTADWSSTAGVSGSLDLFNSFDAFKGTGSYFLGLQAGYDRMLASRWLVGVETDISFPSFSARRVGGSAIFGTPATGVASYAEQAEFFGTLRGRVGYAPGNWLFYATGGFAWSYDQFTRTQLAGVPVGGTAMPGTVENLFMVPRVGGAVGAGVEVALAPSWTARLEYLFTDYASRGVSFPAGCAAFQFRLMLCRHCASASITSSATTLPPTPSPKRPARLRSTVSRCTARPPSSSNMCRRFTAPYHGQNSLDANQGREGWGAMFFAGVKLWDGAELWVDPEIDQGFGPSNSVGVAGYPGGAAYKVGASVPYARIQRAFVGRPSISAATSRKCLPIRTNSRARTTRTAGAHRRQVRADRHVRQNKYATNPRQDFMNWALIDTGTFDYAGDAWGYTYGAAAEWYQGDWTVRGGLFDLPIVPNSTDLDASFGQFQWIGEVERRWRVVVASGQNRVYRLSQPRPARQLSGCGRNWR